MFNIVIINKLKLIQKNPRVTLIIKKRQLFIKKLHI